MKILYYVSVFIVTFMTLTITGCGTMRAYDGPELSDSEIAIINTCSPPTCFFWEGNAAKIWSVDGKELSLIDETVEVLPGKHNLRIMIIINTPGGMASHQWQELILESKPGHIYRVHAKPEMSSSYAWIVDIESDEVVSGIKPE